MRTIAKLFLSAAVLLMMGLSCKKKEKVEFAEYVNQNVDTRLQYVGQYSVVDSFSEIMNLDHTLDHDTIYFDTLDIELYGTNQLRIINSKTFTDQIFTVDEAGEVLNCQGNYVLGKISTTSFRIKTTDDSYPCIGHGAFSWDLISIKTGFKL